MYGMRQCRGVVQFHCVVPREPFVPVLSIGYSYSDSVGSLCTHRAQNLDFIWRRTLLKGASHAETQLIRKIHNFSYLVQKRCEQFVYVPGLVGSNLYKTREECLNYVSMRCVLLKMNALVFILSTCSPIGSIQYSNRSKPNDFVLKIPLPKYINGCGTMLKG